MKALWAAVVEQAATDLADEPYDSVAYTQALVFFTAEGAWAESRCAIADCLDVLAEDLQRYGARVLRLRAARDGGPPVAARPATPIPVSATPIPVSATPIPVSVPATPVPSALDPDKPARRGRAAGAGPVKPREARTTDWWIARFLARHAAA